MQVFKLFMKVLKKKLPTALIYISVFISISIPMVRSSGAEKSFKDTRLKICVFDEDDTEESRSLKSFIESKHKPVEIKNDREAITDALYLTTVDYVLVINKGYSEKLAKGSSDGLFSTYKMHESYSVVLTSQLLDSYVSSVEAYTAGGETLSEAISHAEKAVSTTVEVSYADFSGNSDFTKSFANYFLYMPYIMISIVISAICPVLLTLNKKEMRNRTSCSCIKAPSYSIQVFAGSALFIIGIWLVIMLVGMLINGGVYSGKAWLAVLNSLIFILTSTAIALLICAFAPPENVVSILTQVIGLGMSFLCGVFVPQSILSDSTLAAGRFLPAYWYVRVVNMLSGTDVYDGKQVMICMLIEALFAVVLTLLTMVVYQLSASGKPQLRKKAAAL